VYEAAASIDGGVDSVPNLPKELGKEQVGEGGEVEEAQPPSAELQRVEREAEPKERGRKRGAKKRR